MTQSSNLMQALARIQNLRNSLAEHWRTNFNDVTFLDKVFPTSDIGASLEDVVNYYNLLVKGTAAKRDRNKTGENYEETTFTVDNKKVVEIPAGYYSSTITVSGLNSNEDQDTAINNALKELKQEILTNTANSTAADVLSGKTIAKVVEKEDGTLEMSYVSGTLDSVSLSGSGKVTDPETGNQKDIVTVTANGVTLATDIPYQNNNIIEVLVKNSGQGTVAEIPNLPAGYYASAPTVVIKEDGTDIGEINVEVGKEVSGSETVTDGSLIITPSDNFDYLKSVKVGVGSAAVSAEIVEGNKIKLTPSVVEGWISGINLTGVDENNYIEIAAPAAGSNPTVSVSSDNKVIATIPAGYYAEGTEVELVKTSNGAVSPIEVINSENITPNAVKTTLGEGSDASEVITDYSIVIPEGYNPSTETISLGKSEAVFTNGVTNNIVTSNSVTLTTSEGYTEGETINLTVKEAQVGISYKGRDTDSETGASIPGKIEINTGEGNVNAGWITKAGVILNDNVLNAIVQDNIEQLNTETVQSITNTLGEDFTLTWEDFDEEATSTLPLISPAGLYKKVTLDVSGLIDVIDKI